MTRLYISCVYLFHVVSYSAPNGVVNGVVNLLFLALFAVCVV
ncbi:membrane protein [Escherichia coli O45:H2 str. 2010C-4211]|nr:membrane protein [Escherichia coli O45:H2 str. 2010C-4211]